MVDALGLLDQYFETAFAAPDGIKRLRELILSLAMRGKLVPQDPHEQPANVLLKEIEAEKNRLIKDGKIKKSKPLPDITPDEIPYDLPDSWEWVKLGEVIELISGQHLKPNEYYENNLGFPYYTGPADFGEKYPTSKRYTQISKAIAIKEDILLTVKGAGVGKINVVKEPKVAISRQLMALRILHLDNDFLLYFLKTIFHELQNLAVGIAIPGIGRKDVLLKLFPLPPLEEQRRIVEKIDRLMDQVDVLEKLRVERDNKRLIIQQAAGDRLLKSETEQELGEAWDFLKTHFNELYSVKENISELRKAILQLAVMGKLLPQDPNDPPASELLKEIKNWKSKQITEKVFLKSKEIKIDPNNLHQYQIPNTWTWCCIGNIAGSIVPNRDKPKSFSGGFPWITLSNFSKGTEINLSNNHSGQGLSLEEVEKYNARIIPKNSVVMSCVGQFGLVAVTETDIVCNQQIHGFVMSEFLSSKYIAYVIKSQQKFLDNNAASTTISYLNKTKCESIPIPLPPLPEQHRIVAKVDQLMALCDQLETKIEQRTSTQTDLLNTLIHNT